jgi:hypothetical protein
MTNHRRRLVHSAAGSVKVRKDPGGSDFLASLAGIPEGPSENALSPPSGISLAPVSWALVAANHAEWCTAKHPGMSCTGLTHHLAGPRESFEFAKPTTVGQQRRQRPHLCSLPEIALRD